MNNFLRADGQPRLAMITMFVGAGTNILLDLCFSMFDLGMARSRLGDHFVQALSTVWILAFFSATAVCTSCSCATCA
jgi:Na+-driven multidrug efflux pump